MLTLVPTPIGNLEDITIRALKAIESASLILCEDTRVTKRLIYLLYQRNILSKEPKVQLLSLHEHNFENRIKDIKDRLHSEKVLYMSDAGMPAISDPGQKLVEYAIENGIEYDVLPGATALSVAYAASGFESGKFCFKAFLPHQGSSRSLALAEVLSSNIDTILYESPHRLLKLLESLAIMVPQRELFLAKELTKQYQRYYRGNAIYLYELLKDTTIKGEWVVIVKGNTEVEPSMSLAEVMTLDIPPKPKAKIVAKLTGKSVKECYTLIQNSSKM